MFRYLAAILICMFLFIAPVQAADIPWGVHLLNPQELQLVLPYRGDSSQFFVTVPMKLDENDEKTWNDFFELALKSNITPIIRWVTNFSDGRWTVPNRKQIVEASLFLEKLHWAGSRYLILFNEPNHGDEWGGRVDPEQYVDIAQFAASWMKTESDSYVVLPAGLDAAASSGPGTMESFQYLNRMYQHNPDFFQQIDGWTSHAYPNPGFSSSPYDHDKDSLWGFETELKRLKQLTGRDYDVYVTETGWKDNRQVTRLLPRYYQYSVNNVWVQKPVKAVTFFVFRGQNGPFSDFSLLDTQDNPTPQFKAILNAVKS